jgi:hypothetical protein
VDNRDREAAQQAPRLRRPTATHERHSRQNQPGVLATIRRYASEKIPQRFGHTTRGEEQEQDVGQVKRRRGWN